MSKKDNKTDFLEIKIGLPDCKVEEEMNKLGLKKIKPKKSDGNIDNSISSLNNHKHNKIKKQKKA